MERRYHTMIKTLVRFQPLANAIRSDGKTYGETKKELSND